MTDVALPAKRTEKTITGRIVRAVIALIIGVIFGALHYVIYWYPLLTLFVAHPADSVPQWAITVTENGLQLLYFAFPVLSPVIGVIMGATYRLRVYLLVAILLFIAPILLVILWLYIVNSII